MLLLEPSAAAASASPLASASGGVAGAARIIATACEVEDADIDTATIDSTGACLKETSTTTSSAVGAVANVSGDVMASVSS